ncbi:MAG: hypothetical protein F6J97_23515 [Leptolyngbya sp. SIO4C1]|nr:hypothetical protein [Leptolyngbya sp. SIO4C1]
MHTVLDTDTSVVDWIQSMVNEVYDPCGLAQGLSIGLVDMGLIREINLQSTEEGWKTSLTIRFTSAGCFYFPYFEREIRSRIEPHPQIKSLDIKWDDAIDWTPEDLSEAAKFKFNQHSRRLAASIAQRSHSS